MIARFCKFNTFKKGLFCNINNSLCFRTDFSYTMCSRSIGMISFINKPCIKAYNISVLNVSFF